MRERLRLLGVTTLGELAALPHGPFVRRFGAAAAGWHDRARGIDERPLRPRPRALRIDRTLYGEGEATSEEQVLFALRTLVGRVVDDLAAAGKRAGRLVLRLECEDGEVRELITRVAQPTAVPATLFELLRARLEGIMLGAPVVGLRLAAEALDGGGGAALALRRQRSRPRRARHRARAAGRRAGRRARCAAGGRRPAGRTALRSSNRSRSNRWSPLPDAARRRRCRETATLQFRPGRRRDR